jgi:hypothetical protein
LVIYAKNWAVTYLKRFAELAIAYAINTPD